LAYELPTLATLQPSLAGPCHAEAQEWPPIGVERPKCPAKKNNDKIYQMGSNKVVMIDDM
jgi:hypothetical protein